MTSFGEFETSKARLAALQVLSRADGYELNLSLLYASLEDLGFRLSHDRFLAEMAWLEEQRAVSFREILFVKFACLTQRGMDVAKGTAHLPGVARP